MTVKDCLVLVIRSCVGISIVLGGLLLLTACADRPSFVSIKNAMEDLRRAERVSGIVDIESMHKLDTRQVGDEFVVLLVYKLHFLLSLDEAINLMDESIRKSMPSQAGISEGMPAEGSDVIRQGLISKYGYFHRNDKVEKRVELVYRKKGDQWGFIEMRKPPIKIDYSLFPKG